MEPWPQSRPGALDRAVLRRGVSRSGCGRSDDRPNSQEKSCREVPVGRSAATASRLALRATAHAAPALTQPRRTGRADHRGRRSVSHCSASKISRRLGRAGSGSLLRAHERLVWGRWQTVRYRGLQTKVRRFADECPRSELTSSQLLEGVLLGTSTNAHFLIVLKNAAPSRAAVARLQPLVLLCAASCGILHRLVAYPIR